MTVALYSKGAPEAGDIGVRCDATGTGWAAFRFASRRKPAQGEATIASARSQELALHFAREWCRRVGVRPRFWCEVRPGDAFGWRRVVGVARK